MRPNTTWAWNVYKLKINKIINHELSLLLLVYFWPPTIRVSILSANSFSFSVMPTVQSLFWVYGIPIFSGNFFFWVYGVSALVLNLQQSVRLTRGGGISESLPPKRYREIRLLPVPISYYTGIYGGCLATNQSRNLKNVPLKNFKTRKRTKKILIKNHFKHDSFQVFFYFQR